ncbi:MAG TPA: formyltetrahydrofolate deformylase [Verrucomicrobiae bacterium]
MKRLATITVIGKDKTGVIARITNYLFLQGANIEALEEQVTRGQFSMTVNASWPEEKLVAASVKTGLAALGQELGMEITLRFTKPHTRQRMAIFVTKEPRCLETLLAAAKSGKIRQAEPVLVLGNHRDLEPMAKKAGLPFIHLPWEDRAQSEAKALEILAEHEIDFVVLARFMKILSPNFVWRYKNKIINIHPSLLPSFPGPQAYRQAYEHGVKIIGVTAHFVSMHLDEGPIIAQSAFPVKPTYTLKEIMDQGQKLEAKTLLKGVQLYLTKQLDVHWGKVKWV